MANYKIDQWAVIARGTPYTPPELMERCIIGICKDHPDFPEDHRVTTSAIRYKTSDGKLVTASGSRIELLEIHPDYEAAYTNAHDRLFASLPEID